MCIPKQSHCNLAVDCYDNYDEIGCLGKCLDRIPKIYRPVNMMSFLITSVTICIIRKLDP